MLGSSVPRSQLYFSQRWIPAILGFFHTIGKKAKEVLDSRLYFSLYEVRKSAVTHFEKARESGIEVAFPITNWDQG